MYRYEALADKIIAEAVRENQKVIGITGISCIGKSTFTNLIKKKAGTEYSVEVINVDSYLKVQYRGGTKFWDKSEPYLKPEHFDWEELARDIRKLQNGQTVERQGYVRGIGWENPVIYHPAHFYLVEGLFLDSLQAQIYMGYNKLIKLVASETFIYTLRMARDDYYRKNFKDFKRTKEETVKEIESTIQAEKAYEIARWGNSYLKISVHDGFWLEIEKEEM